MCLSWVSLRSYRFLVSVLWVSCGSCMGLWKCLRMSLSVNLEIVKRQSRTRSSPGPFVFKLKIRGSGTWIWLQIQCLCLYTLKFTLMCTWSPVDSMPTHHPLAAADRLQKLCHLSVHLDLSLIPYEYYSQPPPPGSCWQALNTVSHM